MKFTSETQALMRALYKGREHLELTVGTLKNGQIRTTHFNENKKISMNKLIYPVGSIGKPFTASLLAKRIEEGKIHLDDSLDQFIPDLPEKYYPNILRLATHHSGYGLAPFNFFQMLEKLMNMTN